LNGTCPSCSGGTAYVYDANGNLTNAGGFGAGTYDTQDRMVTFNGGWTYAYSNDGMLRSKTLASNTWQYTYDLLGNLREVTGPSGFDVHYLVDGLNRRVQKTSSSYGTGG
jgi:YD repeat-containing protein